MKNLIIILALSLTIGSCSKPDKYVNTEKTYPAWEGKIEGMVESQNVVKTYIYFDNQENIFKQGVKIYRANLYPVVYEGNKMTVKFFKDTIFEGNIEGDRVTGVIDGKKYYMNRILNK